MPRPLLEPVRFCVGALIVAVALVLVPTIMRARQHVSLHETTRLSIRLNWQSDAPPRMHAASAESSASSATAPRELATRPQPSRVTPRVHVFDEPIVHLLVDTTPDPLRGPPALFSPGV
jgi:hypothetical protein